MNVQVEQVGDAVHFHARNEAGAVIELGTSKADGGTGEAASPMQTLLMALGGCSGIDILLILKKSRQTVTSFRANITGDREAGKVPSLFKGIHVHYTFTGDLDPNKVRRAIDLSLDKYCSVGLILQKTAPITYAFSVNGTGYDAASA